MKRYLILNAILTVSLLMVSFLTPKAAASATPDEDTKIYLPTVLRYATRFSFNRWLYGTPSSLFVWVQDINTTTGWVEVNGVDTQAPTTPFTWDWGDGAVETGWFPRQHTYVDKTHSYTVMVTSHYAGGSTDSDSALARFAPPVITPRSFPPGLAVSVPNHPVTLTTRLYPPPTNLTYFDDSFFTMTPRSTVEYLLSAAAWIQDDVNNQDEYLIDGGFQQVVLRSSSASGMYSLWYTNPPAFVSGNYGFQGSLQYSSFFHEMGHNFSLNSPADFYYGGRINGSANAILSETLANIYAHTTAYVMLNDPAYYGLGPDLVQEIEQSAIGSMQVTRRGYEHYLSTGKVFHSWNDPATSEDETFDTFMTLAYQFCIHAEQSGQGYRLPAKRMMALLQKFNADLLAQYDPQHNTPAADTFRATLMVTALSYAFSTDLRTEFRDLNFPISDTIYAELMGLMNP